MNEKIAECMPANHDFEVVTIVVTTGEDLPGKTRNLRFCRRCGKTSELIRDIDDTFFWSTVDEKDQEGSIAPHTEKKAS